MIALVHLLGEAFGETTDLIGVMACVSPKLVSRGF
jgi:hypothetical protein